MIVWGRYSLSRQNGEFAAEGGRYDPVSDVWTPIATDGQPKARIGQAAVWTGSEMIVWGGYDPAEYFGDGGRYSPCP